MNGWHILGIFLGTVIASGATVYLHRQEQQKPVPGWAGQVCDATWSETRTGEATVGWYHACIREVAKLHEQHKK